VIKQNGKIPMKYMVNRLILNNKYLFDVYWWHSLMNVGSIDTINNENCIPTADVFVIKRRINVTILSNYGVEYYLLMIIERLLNTTNITSTK
jgi:hypothetical protein